MTSGPDPGELPGFWGSMVFRHAPIPRKGSGKQQQQTFFKSAELIDVVAIGASHSLTGNVNLKGRDIFSVGYF